MCPVENRVSRPRVVRMFGHRVAMSPFTPKLIGREPMTTRIPLHSADERAKDLSERLEMSTAEIGLTVRTTNCLEERGIFTVSDLLNCTRDDLLSISNFGEKTLDEVYKALEGIGFYRNNRRETANVA